MREFERLGITVGWNGWISKEAFDDGGFEIFTEYQDGPEIHFDYYTYFDGADGYGTSPEIEDLVADYGYYLEWYNAAVALAYPLSFR